MPPARNSPRGSWKAKARHTAARHAPNHIGKGRNLSLDISAGQLLQNAGHSPVLQGLAIIAGTLVLEDGATMATAMAVQDGHVALPVGLVSLYLGIVLGDLGLYGLGALAASMHAGSAWARRLLPPQQQQRGRDWLERHVLKVVITARFLPGVRLPTYTACGFLGASLIRFTMAAIVATLAWTSLLFAVSMRVGQVLMVHLGAWRWAGVAVLIIVMIVVGRIVARQGSTKTTQ